MVFLLIYTLTVYWFYHVVARSDLMSWPRQWLTERLPWWMVYPLECPFCWAAWTGIALTAATLVSTGEVTINPAILCAAPVLCYLIGLVSTALHTYIDSNAAPARPVLDPHPMIDLSSGPTPPPILESVGSCEYWRRKGSEPESEIAPVSPPPTEGSPV